MKAVLCQIHAVGVIYRDLRQLLQSHPVTLVQCS